MPYRIVGISGSPVKKGNVETFMGTLLARGAAKGMETEAIHLSSLEVKECIHCNFCLSKQKPGKYCALEDDGQAVFETVERADILVLASPVYFMRTSAAMAACIDRLRVFIFGNEARGRLRNKVGVSAAVAWARHGGFETTHLTHMLAFMTLEMLPVSVHTSVSPLGASAVASPGGTGLFDPAVRLGVEVDEPGLRSGEAIVDRAIEVMKLLKGYS